MEMRDFRHGPVYVIGTPMSYPPVYLSTPGNGTWTLTDDILEATSFTSEEAALQTRASSAVKTLVDGRRASVLEITLNIRKV